MPGSTRQRGSCDNVCAFSELCLAGVCQCGADTEACIDDGGQQVCVNTDRDRAHCGGCALACDRSEECVEGRCECPRTAPETCTGADGASFCTDLSFDADHCGACGNDCGDGFECFGSQCRCPATAPTTCVINGVASCANTNTDEASCGMCGVACALNESCAAGTCFPRLFIDEMEDGLNGWTTAVLGSDGNVSAFFQTQVRAASPVTSWHSGITAFSAGDARLTSPSIDLRNVVPGTVSPRRHARRVQARSPLVSSG